MENEFTPEQKKAFSEVYLYSDDAEISEAELEMARGMFDTPEKFRLLRKILQVFTPNERGLTYTSVQSLVKAEQTDLNAYALESAVQHLAQEKVRQSLLQFYLRLREREVGKLKEKFSKQNKAEFEEKKRTEEFEEQKKADERGVGINL